MNQCSLTLGYCRTSVRKINQVTQLYNAHNETHNVHYFNCKLFGHYLHSYCILTLPQLECVQTITPLYVTHHPHPAHAWGDYSAHNPVLLCLTAQSLAMGLSSVFILLLCSPISFPSTLLTISAVLGLSTFSSRCVVQRRPVNMC